MSGEMDGDSVQRLEDFFAMIGEVLRNKKRKASFAAYALGLMGEGDRKSMEPIAARVWGDERHVGSGHQKLQYFMSEADWDDHEVRRAAARYAIEALSRDEPVRTWIIDDTGFLKQGKHSVGVQRQYTGSAGKTANCQIGVSLSVATDHAHVPIDFELFLPRPGRQRLDVAGSRRSRVQDETRPRSWHDRAGGARRDPRRHRPRGQLLRSLSAVPRRRELDGLRLWGGDLRLGQDVPGRPRRGLVRRRSDGQGDWPWPRSKRVPSIYVERRDTRVAVVAFCLVPSGGACPAGRFGDHFSRRMAGHRVAGREALHIRPPGRGRCATKRSSGSSASAIGRSVYEEMKGELGLDHFEGRSFRGWHHHVSVALCCYAFVVAERTRRFLPSTERQGDGRPFQRAA